MSDPDICDMNAFEAKKYFEQHELPATGPSGYDYEYTRCFVIHATSGNNPGPVKDLKIWIAPVLEAKPEYGTPKGPGTAWQDQVRKLFNEAMVGPSNSLDFAVSARTRVAILLEGDFWRFSKTLAPLTTKHSYKNQYFDLRRHALDGSGQVIDIPETQDCRCISFFTLDPCEVHKNVRHGFSLNIELPMTIDGKEVLIPITIDPDIENKGGNN